MAIRFYSKNEAFSEMSDISPHWIEMHDLWYPTIKYYFQSQKFHDAEYREKMLMARTAKDSKTLGRNRKIPTRSDWEEVKDEIMFWKTFKHPKP